MRALVLMILVCACSGSTATVGDTLCLSSAECANDQRCAQVTKIRSPTGDCLATSGTMVCRPICSSCPPVSECGCVCQ